MKDSFTFRQFTIKQDHCAMKVGTDGVLLACWAEGGKRILDIGTGTGVIAIAMAQRFADAQIDAIDIDKAACLQATENKNNSSFASRINIIHSDLQSFNQDDKYNSIVCNPPFFIQSLKCPNSQRNTARHTDTLSPRDLFEHAYQLLAPQGVFSIIIPTEQADQFIAESSFVGFFIQRRVRIKTTTHKPAKRLLLSFKKEQVKLFQDSEETLFKSDSKSEWYNRLTADFYL